MADHGASQQELQQPSYLTSLIQWLRLKRYQCEVTLSLYMLTSTEKAVFYLVVFTLFSLFLSAAYMYLPNHVSIISNRVYYYIMGELSSMSASVGSPAHGFTQLVKKTAEVSVGHGAAGARQTAETVMRVVDEL